MRALGAVLPRPDLVLVLEAPAATLAERKAELPTHELDRQRLAWQHADAGTVAVDATAPADEVLAGAREEIVRVLNERALARLGAGWTGLAGGRWHLPRGPRRAAHAALAVYQPVTVRSRIGWELARAFARVGGFRLLPRRAAPPAPVRRRLAPHLPPRTTFAVARGNAEGRFVALAVGEGDAPGFVAKLAAARGGAAALEREADALEDLSGRLPEPLSAPKLLAREHGMLLLAPVGVATAPAALAAAGAGRPRARSLRGLGARARRLRAVEPALDTHGLGARRLGGGGRGRAVHGRPPLPRPREQPPGPAVAARPPRGIRRPRVGG